MAESQFRLLVQRRFGPFFGAQALGAFNDNVLKNSLVIIVTYHAATYGGISPALLANIAGGLFILPFVLFSGLAGELADRYDKALVLKTVKLAEIAIMAVAGVGFYAHSIGWLLAALFLMGTHSTFFSPAKYGLLPQVLRADELIGGNGLVEMGTFVAILLGTLAAGVLAARNDTGVLVASLAAVAIAGLLVALAIPALPAVARGLPLTLNPVTSTLANLAAARRLRTVFLALLGISWFWFYGSVVLIHLPTYGKEVLGGAESVVTLMLAVFSVGVGIGSLACEWLGGRKIEIGLVPLGSIGLTLFGADLCFATPAVPLGVALAWRALLTQPGAVRLLLDILCIGISGGIFIVPLYAFVQNRSRREDVSRIIGACNILNALFMVAASLLGAAALAAGLSIRGLLLLTALLNALVAAYLYVLVPEFALRFLAYLLVRCIYRLRVTGIGNVPERGPALLVCNHVSYVDGLVISAACPRPIRFVMEAAIFHLPVLNLICRGMKAIPVATANEDRIVREAAFAAVATALRQGELVCIFPEGRLTPDGTIEEFRPGVLRILAETPVAVVPCAISNLWGSMFSRRYRSGATRLPRRFWARIDFRVGAPVPPQEVTPEGLRETVLALRGQLP
jgi:1-acyl-sn-glycerol-3-phosphate acyltransferase